jgi:hypothetical protein
VSSSIFEPSRGLRDCNDAVQGLVAASRWIFCANEIRAIRIKSLADHQLDLSEIDVTEVDRDLLRINRGRLERPYLGH